MSLFNFCKKDKDKKDKKEGKKPVLKAAASKKTAVVKVKEKKVKLPEVTKQAAAIAEKPEAKLSAKVKKEIKVAPFILKEAHITEKASGLQEAGQYVFKVFETANKIEIKKAVEEVYGVDVVNVAIVNIPKKQRRLGRSLGWKKGYKKAVVRIKKDQIIELIPR